jgi:hypothetical protein
MYNPTQNSNQTHKILNQLKLAMYKPHNSIKLKSYQIGNYKPPQMDVEPYS